MGSEVHASYSCHRWQHGDANCLTALQAWVLAPQGLTLPHTHKVSAADPGQGHGIVWMGFMEGCHEARGMELGHVLPGSLLWAIALPVREVPEGAMSSF